MIPPSVRPAIVLFGDSITEQGFGIDGEIGWASLLASAYSRRADVLNRGYSGYNTDHAVELLPRVFSSTTPSSNILFCTVFFGANDASLPGERQHVPMEKYQQNLETIITQIRQRTSQDFPIVLLTPPPVDPEAWASYLEIERSDRENTVSRAYGEVCKAVGLDQNCEVIDSWESLSGSTDDRKQYLSDGLHLNESGNRLIFTRLMECLQTKFPDLAPMGGDGKTDKTGLPLEEDLWTELC